MQEFLQESEIVDFKHPKVNVLAMQLGIHNNPVATAKACFEWVRDEVHHTGDYQDTCTTLKASEVLEYKTGWCYAKSHLLAALLRANGIPTAFCYQRLRCDEYSDSYCLHGLNAIYLESTGWYRVDARGNKKGVNAQFTLPKESLAFELNERLGEHDVEGLYSEPLAVVVHALKTNKNFDMMSQNFPDLPKGA